MAENNIFIGQYKEVDASPQTLRVAVKDNIDVAGYPTTAGTRARQDSPEALHDAAVVSQMRKANITIVGKTNLDELANGATGINPWYGTVANPTDTTRISGGSSAGSAAAVGFGLTDIALGTDTGGSLRIPAALCGVAGLKPTKGLFSTRGVYPTADRMDVIGPMAKDVNGIAKALTVMSPAIELEAKTGTTTVARLRFAQDETEVDSVIDEALEAMGVEIQDLQIPGWQDAHDAAYTIIAHQCWTNNRDLIEEKPEDIGEGAKAVIADGQSLTADDYGEAMAFGNDWSLRIQNLFETYDFLVSPAVSTFAPPLEGLGEIAWESFSRTMQFSLSGHPALVAPLNVANTHLKTGVQFVAPYGQDGSMVATVERLMNLV